MNDLLLVIDVQNGFINEQTKHIPPRIRALILSGRFSRMLFTKFVNREGSFFETDIGWKEMYSSPATDIVPELEEFAKNVLVKYSYTAFTSEFREYLEKEDVTKIYITGLETDICALKTAVDAIELGYTPIVLSQYCATTAGVEVHRVALEILKRFIGAKNVQ